MCPPFSLSRMKLLKHLNKLKSDNRSILKGRDNSFASLLQAEARLFTCILNKNKGQPENSRPPVWLPTAVGRRGSVALRGYLSPSQCAGGS